MEMCTQGAISKMAEIWFFLSRNTFPHNDLVATAEVLIFVKQSIQLSKRERERERERITKIFDSNYRYSIGSSFSLSPFLHEIKFGV